MFDFNTGSGGWIPSTGSIDTPYGSINWGGGGYYYPQPMPPQPAPQTNLFGGGLMPLLLVGFLAYLLVRK